ncbi:MAG: hypothetical protein WC721_19350 [Victivallaceae bacterium]
MSEWLSKMAHKTHRTHRTRISKTVVQDGCPKCRSEEARECGSEKWKARKARKVVNAGNAELGARMSGMIAKLKNIVLNDSPSSRSDCPKWAIRPIGHGLREPLSGTCVQSVGVWCPERFETGIRRISNKSLTFFILSFRY